MREGREDTMDGTSGAPDRAQGTEADGGDGSSSRPGLLSRILGLAPPVGDAAAPTAGGAVAGLANLRTKRLDDVLIPRAEVLAIPVETGLPELVSKFRTSGYTRIPVFETTLDEPLGMIHLKDLALNHGFNGDGGKVFDLRPLLRPLIYAPPSMTIGVLLQKMQTQRIHMALVIDEYGGVDGLVTLEDLIEQVIGEIEDEHDQEEGRFWRQEKTGCYLALARAPLDEFEAEIGRVLIADEADREEVDTLGGLVFMLAGRVPARGEVIPHPDGTEIEVVDADPRRIKRLRVRLSTAGADGARATGDDAASAT